jgi:hypothetical protein
VAKFDDYKTRQDAALDTEIDEAASNSRALADEDNVPDRFKGKTRAEIAASFLELEKLQGRNSNEVGELRQSLRSLEAKLELTNKPAPVAPAPVTLDDIYENADAAVRRVAREESAGRIDKLEKDLQEAKTAVIRTSAMAEFEKRYPKYKDTLASPDFIEWVKASPVRLQMAAAADQGNVDAASELFGVYGELNELKSTKKGKGPNVEAAREVALERSGGSSPAPEHSFSRHELTEKRIAAQRGDRKAAAWLTAHASEIQEAYGEGRLTA